MAGRGPTQEDNFIWLLGALVLLMLCGAMFNQFEIASGHLLVNVSLMITVIVAVWTLHYQRSRWLTLKILMSVLLAGLMVAESLIRSDAIAAAQMITMLVFLGLTIWFAWQEVMFTGEVTGNNIVGAICIYILIGLMFGVVYLLVDFFLPGSMSGFDAHVWQDDLDVAIFYSLVTLTTVGYGDITPLAPLSRFLSVLEAAIGIFYTTVLVASLIGLRLTGDRSNRSE